MDVKFLKAVGSKVNVIPLIAKCKYGEKEKRLRKMAWIANFPFDAISEYFWSKLSAIITGSFF